MQGAECYREVAVLAVQASTAGMTGVVSGVGDGGWTILGRPRVYMRESNVSPAVSGRDEHTLFLSIISSAVPSAV